MPEWLMSILIGIVIISLVGLIYNTLVSRVMSLERWKEERPKVEEILTRSVHAEVCRENTKESSKQLKELILENRNLTEKQLRDMREYFDIKIEYDILSEIRKLNHRGEE